MDVRYRHALLAGGAIGLAALTIGTIAATYDRKETDDARRKNEGTRAARDIVRTYFRDYRSKRPNASLDDVILSFECANEGETLEAFAQRRMRSARGYREVYAPFFR